MRQILSFLLLLLADIFVIFGSIFLGIFVKNLIDGSSLFFDIFTYREYTYVYITIISLFAYQGIYIRRFDFWHESKIIIKSCMLGFLLCLVFAIENSSFSKVTLLFSFLSMIILLPGFKFIFKRILFYVGIWQKKARILCIENSEELECAIFNNHYLGYVKAVGKSYDALLIGYNNIKPKTLNTIIEQNIKDNKEILFTPILNGYDFSRACVYNIFNSRTNLFAIQNSLQSKFNLILKRLLDLLILLLALPLLVIIFGVVTLIIKIKEPTGDIFFGQYRIGLGGKIFKCYKFRSMHTDQSFMQEWLDKNSEEVVYYKKYKKYRNDPRVTKIGSFLRKTSLDELPQLVNVLKGEMSLVGPRPCLPNEMEDFGEYLPLVLSCKPGLTGLWQVSGRNNVDFATRAQMDTWYMKNWSIWMDIVIIIKTFKVVFLRYGAM